MYLNRSFSPSNLGQALILLLLLLLLAVLGWNQSASAASDFQQNTERIWFNIDESAIASAGERRFIPDAYRTLTIDYDALVNRLEQAPMEFTDEAYDTDTVMVLPLPDGQNQRFRIFETSIMAPGLAVKFPELTTYVAIGIDDPLASGRLDLTPAGFHAMIFSTSGTFYIDPYSVGDDEFYISYYKQDYAVPEDQIYEEIGPIGEMESLEPMDKVVSGENLRTYRLAQATTGEYSQFHGGTVPLVMAELVTAINRVTGIYEKEVAVRLELIANNDQLIYLDAGTDPYTNSNGFTMLAENQANIDAVIGNANYDIGHVFSTGGGGVAGLGVVCRSSNKAWGVTGLTSPVGDPFYVDYVAHEMGHQYGGNHPFNGNAGACTGGNRNGPTAYEPGSGSTIMAYAGICGSQNIQSYSDDYFHTISFDEIVNYTTAGSGNNCPTVTSTGNAAPVVDAGTGGFSIPKETPFILVGSATDPNGDDMTFNWEEFDLGPAGHPNNPVGNAPIFRSFLATTELYRIFPQMSDIVNNTQTIGEILPTYGRDLTFRFTARDNHTSPSAGGVAHDTIAFDVSGQAGPFLVTVPNTGGSWAIDSLQSVVWDVANTDAAPVSCTSVDILLSTDGGYNYPQALALGTANDGFENVQVPDIPTSSARVMVRCANNIFFDISNADFTIEEFPPYANLGLSKSVNPYTPVNPGETLTYTLYLLNAGNVPASVTITDTFDLRLVDTSCNGEPGDLSQNFILNAASTTSFECIADVDPALDIEILKEVDNSEPVAGTAVTYTITVTNPNPSTTIENVVVTDPDVDGCSPNLGTPIPLTPLDSQVYVCPDVVVTEDVINTATVTGSFVIANSATASAPEDSGGPFTSNVVENFVTLTDSDSVAVFPIVFYTYMPLLMDMADAPVSTKTAIPVMGLSLATIGIGIIFTKRRRSD